MPTDSYTIDIEDETVATFTNLKLDISIGNPIPADSEISVTFPPEVRLRDESQTKIYLSQVELLEGPSENLEFHTVASDG